MCRFVSVDVVWYKKDLRVHDHQPLIASSLSENHVLCLYVIEPERFELNDFDPIHLEWELDNAIELDKSLKEINASLHFEVGNIEQILEKINAKHEISRLISHQETGNSWSYSRDKKVSSWCAKKSIEWLEFPNNGVIRGLTDRDKWKRARDSRMRLPTSETPPLKSVIQSTSRPPTMLELGLRSRTLSNRPEPGEKAALTRLRAFLESEAKEYQWAISSPTEAVKHGSGLSPYLTVGAISMRRVVQITNDRIDYIRQNKQKISGASTWTKSLSSFRRRLAWRCHFIQKLEMEPDLDVVAQNKIIDRNLQREMNEVWFNKWKDGQTGWPFLDACMRQLSSTGWINFRMRAMIMSAASYNLWLPWRETGCYLATRFIDYEPGIHWSQVGMQSGTTGINTIRAYSLSKQGRDQDPDGSYIRKWVPELSNVPTEYIHQPWEMPPEIQQQVECNIGIEYPEPICDEVESRKLGVKRSYAARAGKEARTISADVLKKHGSRSRPRRRSSNKSKSVQQKLF